MMLCSRPYCRKLKNLLLSSLRSSHLYGEQSIYNYMQVSYYVDVKMKWKKDRFYDSIEVIHKSRELKPLIALKDCIIAEPNCCIPISDVSKRGRELEVTTIKVASFLRKYPSVFEEFTGPNYNLPWFRLTPEAIDLDKEERAVYVHRRQDIVDRLKKLILMTKEKKLPLKIIKGLQWYLGLPDDFLKNPNNHLDASFKFFEMAGGLIGLSVDTDERMLSLLQKTTIKRGGYSEGSMAPLAFPLFPSKGLRLKRKISSWLDMFQNLPYVSPYDECSHLDPNSDVSEKRVVGVLHELLSLFVDHSAERKKLFCLRTHLGLPQKFYKAFERHPHMFYLSLTNKTCTAILKEAYNDDSAMETHPILEVRKKYIELMRNSDTILKCRRHKKQLVEFDNFSLDVDMDSGAGDICENAVRLCK